MGKELAIRLGVLSAAALMFACGGSRMKRDAATVDAPARADTRLDSSSRDASSDGATDGAKDGPLDAGNAMDGSADGWTDAGAILDVSIADERMPDASVPLCGPLVVDGGRVIDADIGNASTSPDMSFFVTSVTSVTGNLGGLAGADQRCQSLAESVGVGSPRWRAYLSAEHDPPRTGPPVHARDRIGRGPWFNARGALVAADLISLHARKGDAAVFLDERGRMIHGQWTGSPSPVEHDVLTGSNADGTLAVGKTCDDWTSDAAPQDGGASETGSLNVARVGHSDGLGPQCSTSSAPRDYTSWSSSHDNAGCNNTIPLGGAGRIYCFKVNP